MWFILCFGIISALLFWQYPELDIKTSALFFNSEKGFYLAENFWVAGIYHLVPIVTLIVVVTLLGILSIKILHHYFPAQALLQKIKNLPTYSVLFYLILALILGPGLVTHEIFKEGFGRPRPREISEFDGNKTYTPPWVISSQEGKSFTSGHAAMGFYITAVALLFSKPRLRKTIYSTGILLGGTIGLVRIMQGGHFLSDIAFTAFTILLLNHTLYRFFFRKRNKL